MSVHTTAIITLQRDADVRATLAAIRMIRGVSGVTVIAAEGPMPVIDLTDSTEQRLSVDDIVAAVCKHYRVTPKELISGDRHKYFAMARHVAMYLCKRHISKSFPELGRAFGGRDHTTVMGGVRKVERLIATDDKVRMDVKSIERRFPERATA